MTQKLSKEIFQTKYMVNGETSIDEVIDGVSLEIARAEKSAKDVIKWRAIFAEEIRSGRMLPAGRVLANARTNPIMPYYNNCYTIGVEDSMDAITKALADYMTIMKTGGGVGFNISKLRPKEFPITTGGTSSGPLSFAEIFNTAATTISSAGGRRGATMLMLDCDHPDVEEFITYKQGDENKKLTQMNISVVVTDAFMNAAKNDEPWELKYNGVVVKTVKAKELMDKIIANNFDYAEPGIMFKTTANKNNNIHWDKDMEMIVTNPCGEIIGAPYFVCCLTALNLAKFVRHPFTDKSHFDFEAFIKSVKVGVRFLDNVLSRTKYPIPEIEEQANKYRRIGLGITGLADMLAMVGYKYGSEKAVRLTEGVMSAMRDTSYDYSAELAQEKGSFLAYNEEFLFGGFVQQLPNHIQEKIAEHGIRNAYLGTVAPTGTTSLSLGNNCSSGVEPIFALKYQRSYRIGDSIDEKATETVYNNAYLEFIDQFGEEAPTPDSFVTSNDLTIDDHIKMQAVVQKYIDQSVSKTITLPTGSSKEDMKDVYYKGWENGLKGCTVFNPDGKLQAILFIEDKKPSEPLSERPKVLPANVHEFMHKRQKYHALVGMNPETNTPYEIFVIQHDNENYRKWVGDFSLVREDSDHYALYYNDKLLIDKVTEEFGYADEAPFTCLAVSNMMRNGNTMRTIVDTLSKKTLVTSFPKALGRVLSNYLEEDDGEVHCPECNEPMTRSEGCYVCLSCGYGKCG